MLCPHDTVDGSEIRRENPPGMVLKLVVNNGINYLIIIFWTCMIHHVMIV